MRLWSSIRETFPPKSMQDVLNLQNFSAGLQSMVPIANLFPRVSFPAYGSLFTKCFHAFVITNHNPCTNKASQHKVTTLQASLHM